MQGLTMNMMMRRAVPVVLDNDTQEAFKLRELAPFIGAIITGGFSGCVAFAWHARTRREALAAYAIAYSITGAFGALMTLAAAGVLVPLLVIGWNELFLISGAAGLTAALALAGANLSMRFILRQIGLEVQINVSRKTRGDE